MDANDSARAGHPPKPPKPTKRATPFEAITPEVLDRVASDTWDRALSTDQRLGTLINACMGGRLTFEQMAEGMFSIGFIYGAGAMMATVETMLGVPAAPETAEPSNG